MTVSANLRAGHADYIQEGRDPIRHDKKTRVTEKQVIHGLLTEKMVSSQNRTKSWIYVLPGLALAPLPCSTQSVADDG